MHTAVRHLTAERRWLLQAIKALDVEADMPGANLAALERQALQLAHELAEITEALRLLAPLATRTELAKCG
jgi:hypothetical protein